MHGNLDRFKDFADGGPVKIKRKPMKPHIPAKIKDPIAKSKHKLQRVKKKADGGKVHGSPLSTPRPGSTTRKRPKVGDKSGDTHLLNPGPPRSRKKAPTKKKRAFISRDYRGVDGAVEDAGG